MQANLRSSLRGTFRSSKTPFAIIFILSILATLPLIVGNVHYLDDYYRYISGDATYWAYNGRPMAVWLAWLFNFSTIINDLSPLFLLLGLAVLAGLLTISLPALTGLPQRTVVSLSLVVMCSPFITQPMLYSYDVFSILLAIGLSFLGCAVTCKRVVEQIGASTLIFLTALCLYQTAANHCLINLALMLVTGIARGEAGQVRVRAVLAQFVGLLVAIAVYQTLITPYYMTDAYNQARSVTLPLSLSGFRQMANNGLGILQIMREAFPSWSIAPVVGIFLIGALGCWKIGLQQLSAGAPGWFRFPAFLFCLAAPFLTCFTIAGFLIFFVWPTNDPRVLTAFSSALLFNIVVGRLAFPWFKRPLAIFTLLYLGFSMVYMIGTFRAVVNQTTFDEGLAVNLRSDLSRLSDSGIDQISIIGQSPLAPAIQPILRNYPLTKRIIYPALAENFPFVYYAFMNRYMVFYPLGETTVAVAAYKPEQVISSNCIYRLYQYRTTAVIDFKVQPCSAAADFTKVLPRQDD